ncbi:ABC transporter permease [Variovorax sp. N23]|uniref:ABC transporter permease n=1 Tax=Variovorax sp. N23 TaxID=2980555 RepID=UPI0021C56E22|nr:ABC transporter permease [Variovorax sp. N23]MCU4117700.1 ABC transporter permease [Variovorax sp. N23]
MSLAVRSLRYLAKVAAITGMDMRKLRHDPTELLTRAIQPMLWLLVFGQVFARAHAVPTGGVDYIAFLVPGILAQSVLFVAIFNGISVIWERDLGIVHKFLASPTPRTALVLGKALASGARALTQAVIVYGVAMVLGVPLVWSPQALLGVVTLVLLGAALFSTFSLIIACIVKTRERFMGIGQVLTMPLFFASNAIYPTEIMPPWLKVVAHLNPLSYVVDGLRALMLVGGSSTLGLGMDFGVLVVGMAVLVWVGGWMYPRLIT